ncbi:hypothetical protein V8F20_006860 [Naviculisporaceae sp. PSN 640]
MAEVALGVLPIFFTACQGFVVLLDKIHLFRHYKKEIRWLRLKVSVQSKCYKDELHRLVIATLDAHKAQSLITDDNHSEWKNPNLERIFEQYMGKLFGDFLSAVRLIHESLASIQDKLDAFAPPDIKSPRFKAISDHFKLAFKKDQYKEDIDNLKEMIAELKRVRELAATFAEQSAKMKCQVPKQQKAKVTPTADIGTIYEEVRKYKAMRSLSSALQDFLQQQWTCCSTSHSHGGRLFLTSAFQPPPSVLVLLESEGQEGQRARVKNRLFFKVGSQPHHGLLTPESETPLEIPRLPKRQRLSPQPSSTGSRIRSDDRHSARETTPNAIASLCKELETISLQPAQSRQVTRLDARHPEGYRFDPLEPLQVLPHDPSGSESAWNIHEIEFRPLAHLLGDNPHRVMLDRDRVQLAAALVRGTLMGHSTAGWPGHRSASSGCILEGISFIHTGTSSMFTAVQIETLLSTLNIPVDVGNYSGCSRVSSSDAEMRDAGESVRQGDRGDASESADRTQAYVQTGVQNLELYRLGVALLSLARWQRVPWQDVVSVRRKASALSWGGEAYKTAVKSLIDCDFGAGDDLDVEKIQFEVMRRVVGPLEREVEAISASIRGGSFLSSENMAQGSIGAAGGRWLDEVDRMVEYEPREDSSSQSWIAGTSGWAWPPSSKNDVQQSDSQAMCLSPPS